MTVTVNGNLSSYVTTDNDGRFTVVLVDSLPELGHVVVTIKAIDPRSDDDDSIVIEFDIPDNEDASVEDQNNFWFWVIFYLMVLLGTMVVVYLVTSYTKQGKPPVDE